jgi:hypothetical protein
MVRGSTPGRKGPAAKNLYDPAVQAQDIRVPPALPVACHCREQYGYAVYHPHGSGNWLITYTLFVSPSCPELFHELPLTGGRSVDTV